MNKHDRLYAKYVGFRAKPEEVAVLEQERQALGLDSLSALLREKLFGQAIDPRARRVRRDNKKPANRRV